MLQRQRLKKKVLILASCILHLMSYCTNEQINLS